MNDPWLVNLDWRVKHLKGSASKKKAHLKALKEIEEYYRKGEVFQRSGREKAEEEKVEEEEKV